MGSGSDGKIEITQEMLREAFKRSDKIYMDMNIQFSRAAWPDVWDALVDLAAKPKDSFNKGENG